ncbi:hypothetical protein C9J85_15780 [Haloferax sp. wsp5]|nr:hypothetical protein C9J85_15780 [Haloferax sp. wsp5]
MGAGGRVATPLGTSDYSTYLSEAADCGADVLVLNHYGLDGANSVSQAVDAGIDEDMELVVPLYNRPMAEAAGGAIEGIYGTSRGTRRSTTRRRTRSRRRSGRVRPRPVRAGPARLRADAPVRGRRRAGRHVLPAGGHPAAGGLRVQQHRHGPETMRGCDHQAQRDVPVVQGLPAPNRRRELHHIVEITSRDDVGYACESGPAAECELGEYGDEWSYSGQGTVPRRIYSA